MIDMQCLSDDEVQSLASHWRALALRGAREARGQAHVYETEWRRRRGALPSLDRERLDLRSLDERTAETVWWHLRKHD